ncbi:GAF domain-containing protein [Klenkia brasiliensis]|uniref:GAF domain-containing protein n=1 Tax=Klenkia brasiliensis TaxID=333142 RepID=A0A1G7QIW5_9ACTN|nr:GAF domain-containing protein [Klenkia brasiliensis]SDF98463.1 GAF domain-containing protein [Klenkia brasiliensis]
MSAIDADTLARTLRDLGEDPRAAGEDLLNASLQRVVDACAGLFDIAGCGLMLADEDGGLRYVVATDDTSWAIEEAQLTTGEGPCVDSFEQGTTTTTGDVAADQRWPRFGAALARAVEARTATGPIGGLLGTPLRLHGTVVGSLDVHHSAPMGWTGEQVRALERFGRVAETILAVGVQAHQAGRLAAQLDYAIGHRAPIERGVGYLMARDGLDQRDAFAALRRAARSSRRPIADVARGLTLTGRLPGEPS